MILEENENKIFTVREIQSGDSLLSIANSVGMSAEQLMDFHNLHCGVVGLMWLNSLVGRDKILIPKNYKSPAQIKAERKEILPKPIFSSDFYADFYEIKETFDNDLIVAYQVELKSEKEKNTLKISKNNFRKNNISAEDKISDIALACAQSIEPVILKFSNDGFPAEIQNHEQMMLDFEKEKPKLIDYYEGDFYTTYLEKFEKDIADSTQLLDKMRATLLYQILFPDKKWFDKKEPWSEDFFFVQGGFSIKCLFNAEYHLDFATVAETIIQAENTDEYSITQLLNNAKNVNEELKEPAQLDLKITYRTNKITKQLESANAELRFWNRGQLHQEHKISITEI